MQREGNEKEEDIFIVTLFYAGTLKRREREVGPEIESLAKRSCPEALKEEKSKTTEGVAIAAGYDMGWQKRGKAHNSLSGVGHFIGKETGKVVGYGTRNRHCAICHLANRQQVPPRPHDCRMNWFCSSHAMEADVAVEVAKQAKEAGYPVGTIIGDDDATTVKQRKGQVDENIQKVSDVVHSL